jgi:dolichol-phosphate mannosyltransferase
MPGLAMSSNVARAAVPRLIRSDRRYHRGRVATGVAAVPRQPSDQRERMREVISVVIPCLNEERNVRPLYDRLARTLEGAGVDHEIIFSLDPCTDRTEDVVRELRIEDPRVKLLRLSRRFGQPAATMAGLRMSSGAACVVIDCDLQDPPELIAEMIERWREGFDVVYAQRRSRAGETLPKRAVAAVGYRVIRRVAEVDIPANTGDFRLMSRRVVDEVLRLNETHGFLRGLVALVGFPQTSVLYDRDARTNGQGKYNRFTGSLRIGVNGLVGFSRYPLQVITWVGLSAFAFATLLGLTYLCLKLAGVNIVWGNPTLVMVISFFSGLQLLSLGVMGEYVGRIYDEVKRRPLFIVERMEGFGRGAVTRDDPFRATEEVSTERP